MRLENILKDKRGRVKSLILIAILFFILFFIFITINSKISTAIITKDKYLFGESVKINLRETQIERLKIITPKTSYMVSGKKEGFIFKPEQLGNYKIIAYSKRGNKEFLFEVVSEISKTDILSQEQTQNDTTSEINDTENDNSSEAEYDEKSQFDSFGEFINYSSKNGVIINQPVKWKVEDNVTENRKSMRVKIHAQAKNISAYAVTKNGKRKVDFKVDSNSVNNAITTLTTNDTPSVYATIESIEANSKLEIEYFTDGPVSKEKEINSKEKEIVINSGEMHYENVKAYTQVNELVKNDAQIKVYWEEEDEYLSFDSYDKDLDGLIDVITWNVPHLSEQTFRIIVITQAEHLDEDKKFLSDIYEEVKSQDGIYSEEIKDGEYVRVTFEKNLTNGNDITIFPRIISGNPQIYVYEKGQNRKLAEFDDITSENYSSIYFKNLREPLDSFDLKVIGGSLQFDYIVDPVATALVNTDASATSTGSSTGIHTGGKNIIKLDSNRLIAYWEDGANDASCADSNDGGTTWNAYSSLAGTHGDLAIASNGSSIVYLFIDEGAGDLDYVYRTTGVCDIASGAGADINAVSTNDNYRGDVAYNGVQNIFVTCSMDNDDFDIDYTRAPVLATLTWTATAGVGGANTINQCSIDVNDRGETFIIGNKTGGIQMFNSSNNFTHITNTSVYSASVSNVHLSIRGNEVLVTGVDNNNDLVLINNTNGMIFSSTTLTGTFREAESCIDSVGNYNVILGNGSNIQYIQYKDRFFSNLFPVVNHTNALRYPSVRCTNFPASNRMTDGQLDFVYTILTANDVYYGNYTILNDTGIYGNPLVNISLPLNTTYNSNYSFIPFNISLNEPGICLYSLNSGTTNYTMTGNHSMSNFNASNSTIADGFYTIRAYCNDTVDERNFTQSQTFRVDRTNPQIEYGLGTEEDYGNFSRNHIYINVSVNETNEVNITFTLFNTTGQVNITTLGAGNRTINWTNLLYGAYTYNVTVTDIGNNINSTLTRNIYLDSIKPNVNILFPISQNYTVNILDLNFSAYDLGIGIDSCIYSLDLGTTNNTIIGCTNTTISANQGNNTLFLYVNDSFGNNNYTQNVSFFVDSLIPEMIYVLPTPLNGSTRSDTYLNVNVSLTEINFVNITFELFNISSGAQTLVNRTTFYTPITEIIWYNINNTYMNYTYNVTVYDILGNVNVTPTRTVYFTSGDFSPPDIFINSPTPNGYYHNQSSIYFEVTLSEEGSFVNYRLNNSATNYSMLTNDNFNYNATNSSIADGNYELIIFANDTLGNGWFRRRNFTIDTTYPNINFGVGTSDNYANVSRDWIFVNVSVNETNELILNFTLYDINHNLLNTSEFTDGRRTFNWTALTNGVYYYNVSMVDQASNINFTLTRRITLDNNNPGLVLNIPENNSFVNIHNQNLTVNLTDNFGLDNATLFVYNSTNDLINQTTVEVSGTEAIVGVIYQFVDGIFNWFFKARDIANNEAVTSVNNTLTVDTIFSQIDFSNPTENNGSVLEQNFIFVNLSIDELNFGNISFELYNETGDTIVNRTFYNTYTENINWSEISNNNITYSYNVTIVDKSGNTNFTETRFIKLADLTNPVSSLINPINKTYFTNTSLLLSFTASDYNLDSCWYNVDHGTNVTIPGCSDYFFNVSEGAHTLFLFANDSTGLYSSSNVTFVANSSLFQPRTGLLTYGKGTDSIPRYRIWNGTGFGPELNGSGTTGTIEWIKSKQSPSRDEYIVVSGDSSDNLAVQINSSLGYNSVSCWHNGTDCDNIFELTSSPSSSSSRQKFDVAYETLGEEAIVVWSDNDASPQFRIWNGSAWSIDQTIPQTLISGGIVSYLKLASHPFRDEIALLMTNTSSLNILIWNGTAWGCEPASLPSTVLITTEYQHADLAYEQSTGDLLVVSSTTVGLTEIDMTSKEDGSCSYSTTRSAGIEEDANTIVLSPKYDSDNILIGIHTPTGSDMDNAVWLGSSLGTISAGDNGVYASSAVPNLLIASAWAGTSPFGIIAYSDVATSLNIDYFRYNETSNTWTGLLDATGLTNFFDEEQNIRGYSYVDENSSLFIVQDDADNLYAKAYNGQTDSWFQPDNGVNLSGSISSTSFPSFDFEFDNDRAGPSISIISPSGYFNSSDILFNLTTGERATTCLYSLDGQANITMDGDQKNYYKIASSLSSSDHLVEFTCEDVWENIRTVSREFTIDTTLPLVNYGEGTSNDYSNVSRNWIYVNVSVVEIHEENITFTLFNTTGEVNITTLGAGNRTINWTGLSQGIYYYNITVRDIVLNQNTSLTRRITLDTTNPAAELLTPLNGTNSNNMTQNLTVNLTDNLWLNNATLYVYNSSDDEINQTTVEVSGTEAVMGIIYEFTTEGFFKWFFKVFDISGNEIASTENNTIFIDTTFPLIDYASNSEINFINVSRNNIFINVSVTELYEANITFTLYNSTGQVNITILGAGNRSLNFTSLDDGIYFYNVTATDTSLNQNTTQTYRIVLDTTVPSATLYLPEDVTNTTQFTQNLSVNLIDNIELQNATLYVYNSSDDEINQTTVKASGTEAVIGIIYEFASEGLYKWFFRVFDIAGNNAFSSTNNTLRVDITAPGLNILYPVTQNYTVDVLDLNISAIDLGSGIETCWYSLDFGATNNSILGCFNISIGVPQGNNTLFLFANDTLGNLNNSENVSFFVDSIIPEMIYVLPTPLNGSTRSDTYLNVNVSLTETNFVNITFELFNISSGAQTLVNRTTFYTPISEIIWYNINNSYMNYTYNVTVYDILGNVNVTPTRTVYFTPGDFSPPDIFFLSPTPNGYFHNQSSIFFEVTLSEEGSFVNYRLNNSATNYSMITSDSFIYNATNTSIADGNYELIVYANDTLGNGGFRSRNFTIDTIYPLIQYGVGTSNDYSNVSRNWIYVNVSVNETNELIINFTLYDINHNLLNTSEFTDGRRTFNWTALTNGVYYYNVSMVDQASNINFTLTRRITLDTVLPTAQILSPLNESFVSNSIHNMTVNLSDNIQLSNATLNVYNSSEDLVNQTTVQASGTEAVIGIIYEFVTDGIFSWFYNVFDKSGNQAVTSENYTIIIDTTDPSIIFGDGTKDDYYNATGNTIYVNVSVIELHEANISFYLFNSTFDLINITTYYDNSRTINFTELVDGFYYYNVSMTDLVNNTNSSLTRRITLDNLAPNVNLTSPLNASWSNNLIQNFSLNVSDNLWLSNLTIRIYNSTSSSVNVSTRNVLGQDLIYGIMVTLPYDDNFTWSYESRDVANGLNFTENNSIFIDTTIPQINFTSPTENNGTVIEQDFIFVNVSGIEMNFENMTFELFNNTGNLIVNRTVLDIFTESINFTNLSTLNVTYSYNVTIVDKANNRNVTETRYIKLADLTNPSVILVEPKNRTYYDNMSMMLSFSISDKNLDTCFYNIDLGTNITLPGCNFTTFNVSEGAHSVYLYANDSIGLWTSTNVTFVANASLYKPIGGILVYGEGTLQAPRYRFWNGTGFDDQKVMPGIGGTVEWVRVRTSPSRDEQMVVIANSADDVSVQMNGTLQNGTTCWNNGTTCNYGINLTQTSTGINRLKADMAYETTGEDAIVVWSQNNQTPMYKVWNGENWSESLAIPQTLIGSGVISYIKAVAHPHSEEVAVIMTNTTSGLSAIIWNGTSWGCEPTTQLSNNITPDVYQHADLAYEQASGDLFIAVTHNGPTAFYSIQKQNGTCDYVRTYHGVTRENEIISLGARYESDYIGVSAFDITNNQFTSGRIWNGTGIQNESGVDSASLAETSAFLPISFAWAGTSQHGILTYADAANVVVDYFKYNITQAAWEGGTTGVDVVGLTAMTNSESTIFSTSYVEENKSLFIIRDASSDLWAKAYNGDTNTWFQPDYGTVINNNIASIPFQAFDFEFDNDRAGPSITVIMPRQYYQNVSNVFFNLTLGEDGLSCIYSVDGDTEQSISMITPKVFSVDSVMLSEGDHNATFRCIDTKENSRTDRANFLVDTVYPQIYFTNLTEENGTIVERDWIFVNVSVTEINEANITFNLYSDAHVLINSTNFGSGNRSINWTGLSGGIYHYNVTIIDLATNINQTLTRTINLSMVPPVVTLLYPINYQNISGFIISNFSYTVSDNSTLINCSLYANYSGSWIINYSTFNPTNNGSQIQNFSFANVTKDGSYIWNVKCIDQFNNTGFAPVNFTFSNYIFPNNVILFNISQTSNDGTGNITLYWNASNHTNYYAVYYTNSLNSNFSYLNSTTELNYTDSTFNGSVRRFYRVDSVNPTGQNNSDKYFGVHVYQLSHLSGVNTRNWIGFPSNATYLGKANETLNEIRNATAFTMWNSTLQKRVTCNKFSCPDTLSCTASNCNFNFTVRQGYGYEVNLNDSAPANVNWSLVGFVNLPQQLFLEKNATSFGKNWIGIQANTTLRGATDIYTNISNSDAVSRWNAQAQTSQGLIPSPFPFGNPFIGTNFTIVIEQGYEVSVTTNYTWRQR